MTNEIYEKWLAGLRSTSPPETLPDQIMSQVAELERQRQYIWWLRCVQRIEHSGAARWAVCGGALAVGGFPFVFLAYVSKVLTF